MIVAGPAHLTAIDRCLRALREQTYAEVPRFALSRDEVRGTDSLQGFALLPWLGRARFQARELKARRA